jgi:hypothetical protein
VCERLRPIDPALPPHNRAAAAGDEAMVARIAERLGRVDDP